MKWRIFCTISNSLMVHAQILEAYIHFALMYTADHIFQVLPTKDLINEEEKLTTPFKLTTSTKPPISYLRVLFILFCTKSYYTCWGKGVKHASPNAKGFSRYFCCNSTASKRVSCLRTRQTQGCIFVRFHF